jgi:hypothetical protein
MRGSYMGGSLRRFEGVLKREVEDVNTKLPAFGGVAICGLVALNKVWETSRIARTIRYSSSLPDMHETATIRRHITTTVLIRLPFRLFKTGLLI